MWDGSAFIISALSPKFYVALTGTSSLISGLILIFEWWYFRKYGTSFIEQVSLTHLGPWIGAESTTPANSSSNISNTSGGHSPLDCKVWRNPLALLRGAEYGRLWSAKRQTPLTYYDMNLSAQEHQAWFGCNNNQYSDGADEAMALAWREREPMARVAAARAALAVRPDCAAALLLLAEEDAPTVLEADRVLKKAWRAAENALRAASLPGGAGSSEARRVSAVLAHIKRRSAMCARRLGRLRDAVRLFRDLLRDAPPALAALSLHENVLEILLEQRAYQDVQAVVSRCEDTGQPPSAALLYTAALTALTRARVCAGAHAQPNRNVDDAAMELLRRAIEFNPYVPPYLLEQRAITFPPEHVLRRGDSEAVAYAFFHLRHWRASPQALSALEAAWGATRGGAGGARCADTELLPPHHCMAHQPRSMQALPAAVICVVLAAVALLVHKYAPAAPIDPTSILRLLADV